MSSKSIALNVTECEQHILNLETKLRATATWRPDRKYKIVKQIKKARISLARTRQTYANLSTMTPEHSSIIAESKLEAAPKAEPAVLAPVNESNNIALIEQIKLKKHDDIQKHHDKINPVFSVIDKNQIKILKNNISDFDEQFRKTKKHIAILEKRVIDRNCEINGFELKVQNVRKEILQFENDNRSLSSSISFCDNVIERSRKNIELIHKNQQLHAEMMSHEFIPGNAETEKLLQEIKRCEKIVQEHVHKFRDNSCNISKLQAGIRTRPKKLVVDEEIAKSRAQLKRLIWEIKNCERLIKEEIMLPRYISYGIDNRIISNLKISNHLIDRKHLFRVCNEHYQNQLIEDLHINITLRKCEINCHGWYVRNTCCECRNYTGLKWNDDDADFSDIWKFNIASEKPFGYADFLDIKFFGYVDCVW